MNRPVRALARRLSLALLALFLFAALAVAARPQPAQAQPPAPPRTVFVHLFEWKWTDVALECERFLGPKGFAAVQVSPPQEHAVVAGFPWWQRYQPVSYRLESRGGTRAQFVDMVQRCKAVGVDIYADAVINHMTGVGSGTGSAGSTFTPYTYPGIYQNQDFHHCGRNGTDDIQNYGDRYEVQNCELVNLADLNTGSAYVRDKLGAYLNDLMSTGVAGFRVDAVKHISAEDMAAIFSRVGGAPYIYQEVIGAAGEPIQPPEYFGVGDVSEFKYSSEIGRVFLTGQLAWLQNFGAPWGFMASDKAVVFTDNHDNQRGHGGGGTVVTYKSGTVYDLANVFMLAWPYGYPQVMSSFAFSNGDQGPPSDASGNTNSIYVNGSPNCFGEWVCEHRWRPIANMVAFRNHTSGNFFTTDWWSNGNNQIAFGRGNAGYVVINREGGSLSRTFQTSLPAGTYCNVIYADFDPATGTCSGQTVTVNGAGQFTATVQGMGALAIHAGAKLGGATATATPTAAASPTPSPTASPTPSPTAVSSAVAVTFSVNATTTWGQNVYVVGNIPALGSWNTANAVPLSAAGYPIWSGAVSLPPNTAVEYKYIKKNGGTVIWECCANRTFTTPGSGSLTRSDTWRN